MDTTIKRYGSNTFLLEQANASHPEKLCNVMATMERKDKNASEDQSLWQIRDVRLSIDYIPGPDFRFPKMYDVTGSHKVKGPEDRALVTAMLNDYVERDGVIRWNPHNGLARGPLTNEANGMTGLFSLSDGLEYMKDLQEWWQDYDGSFKNNDFRVHNPHRQPMVTLVWDVIAEREYVRGEFESHFREVVSGLREYYEVLNSPDAVEALRVIAWQRFIDTGATQADYEALRDRVEVILREDPSTEEAARSDKGGADRPKG